MSNGQHEVILDETTVNQVPSGYNIPDQSDSTRASKAKPQGVRFSESQTPTEDIRDTSSQPSKIKDKPKRQPTEYNIFVRDHLADLKKKGIKFDKNTQKFGNAGEAWQSYKRQLENAVQQ